MKDNSIKNNYSKSEKPFLFGKRNYRRNLFNHDLFQS